MWDPSSWPLRSGSTSLSLNIVFGWTDRIGLMDHKLTFDFTIMTHEHTVLNTPQSHTFLSIH